MNKVETLALPAHPATLENTGFSALICILRHVGDCLRGIPLSDVHKSTPHASVVIVPIVNLWLKLNIQFDSVCEARFVLGLGHVAERTLIVIDMQTLLNHAALGMSDK